ncbi:toprim domain-containing protein [Spartinivicinus ruber]|uniref:toprim domain-containing protein n=1 Tax=Spartinivicinus ruber TaxID=2683272 RepID=UPI0013D0FCC9|nr:toprim domain-containing protein [Spartinivicinus ruber]
MTSHLSTRVVSREPCPRCGSQDNVAVYDDGHANCYTPNCNYFLKSNGEEGGNKKSVSHSLIEGNYKGLVKRKISEETCRKLGYKVGRFKDKSVHIANYVCPKTHVVQAQKIRFPDKTFTILGNTRKLPFFGWHTWRNGGRKLVITEGEIDALSVSEAQNNKYPVVSLPNGASSVKQTFLDNKAYLDGFEEIIIMFDNDEPGQIATEEACRLLGAKARVASLPFKDANEALVAGRIDLIIPAIWDAKPFKPACIFTGEEVLATAYQEPEMGLSWPFPTLTQATYGKRPNEMYAIGSGTGCGKTDLLKEDIAHNIGVHNEKCMTFFLEEPNLQLTLNTIAGKVDSKLYHVPGSSYDYTQFKKTREKVAQNLLMYAVDGNTEPEDILQYIRLGVEGYGARHVYLDHITYIMDAVGEGQGLEVLKSFMRGLNDLNKELPFTLYYVSHLRKKDGKKSHEEGGRVTLDDFAGGKANVQYANFTFALERDQQAEEDEEKNKTVFRILKDRYTGQSTGTTINLLYDPATGRKQEHDPFDVEDVKESSTSGF